MPTPPSPTPPPEAGWLPNCATALRLAQTGVERPLRWSERLALRYHGRLCLFCSCQQDRFARARRALADAEATRRSETGGY